MRGVVEVVEERKRGGDAARHATRMLATLDQALTQLQRRARRRGQAASGASCAAHLDEIERPGRAAAGQRGGPAGGDPRGALAGQLAELLAACRRCPRSGWRRRWRCSPRKADVREELDRLAAHVAAARDLLADRRRGRPQARFPAPGIQPRGQHAVLQVGGRSALTRIGLDAQGRDRPAPRAGRRTSNRRRSDRRSIQRRGLMLVLSSPSGAGKTTISRRLLLERDADLALSVSVTTRPQRPGEVDGVDYHFIDRDRFDRDGRPRASSSNTPRCSATTTARRAPPVEAALAAGRDVLFDIDWQGTQQLAASGARRPGQRLHPAALDGRAGAAAEARAQDSAEVVAARMAKAADEMSHWAEYDYVIVNRRRR